MRRPHPVERLAHACPCPPELLDRGGIGTETLVSKLTRAKLERGAPGHPVGHLPHHQLARPAADIHHRDRPGQHVSECACGAAKGKSRLLLRGQHRNLEATRAADSGNQRVAIRRPPGRGRGDAADILRPQLAGRLELSAHHQGHLGNLRRADLRL